MHPADMVVQILTDAAAWREDPEVIGAYRQLAGLIEAHLIGEAFFEVTPPETLSPTQQALIRHGLRGMGEGLAFQSIQRAASQLRSSLRAIDSRVETPMVEDALPDEDMTPEDQHPLDSEDEEAPTMLLDAIDLPADPVIDGMEDDAEDDAEQDEVPADWADELPEDAPYDAETDSRAIVIRDEALLSAQTADAALEPPPRENAQPDSFKNEYYRRAAIAPPPPRPFRFSRQPTVITRIDSVSNSNLTVNGIQYNHTIAYDDVITAQGSAIDSSQSFPEAQNGQSLHYDVFLSYSRRNARMMRRIKEYLISEGFTVWTDENLTPGTDDWQRAIETAINNSNCMVALMSPDAHHSKWVNIEINYARDHGVFVVPVLIKGDERTSIPFALTLTQHLDMRGEAYRAGMQQLLRYLRLQRRD